MKFMAQIAAALVSGLLLYLSLPARDFAYLAWIAIAPLCFVLIDSRPWRGFLLGYTCGLVFFPGVFNWVRAVPSYSLLHHLMLDVYLSCYFGLFGMGVSFITRRLGAATGHLSVPFLWVSQEYVRSNMSFLALPWGLLAHSQYQHPLVLQMTSITGAFGLSFLIALVNSSLCLAALASAQIRRTREGSCGAPIGMDVMGIIALTAVFLCAAILYGRLVLHEPIEGRSIKVAVVQGNMEQANSSNPAYTWQVMETYDQLTSEAASSNPDLIVWPEGAIPLAIDRNTPLYHELRNASRKANTYLLLGSSRERKFMKDGARKRDLTNSAYLISPGLTQDAEQRYDKNILVPFGEYLPFADLLPWSILGIPSVAPLTQGKEIKVFATPAFRFGVSICWENIFGDYVRQFVANGAQFIVNITNEAWFGGTEAPYQFLAMSVFRAAENRIFVVRCGNTGISCVVDPHGHILSRLEGEGGEEIFVRGVLTGNIVPLDFKTFYTRHGEWVDRKSVV